MKAVAAKSFGAHIDQLPPFLYWEYYRKLQSSSDEFLQSHVEEVSSFGKLELNPIKNELTNTSIRGKQVEVKSQLPSLLDRLNRATSETGKISALADFLGAPLASVSRWLSGKREPGGEITLKMLKWVEQQERQK